MIRKPQSDCYDLETLGQCLDCGSPLPSSMAEHLDGCDSCRKALEYVAGQSTWWDEARDHLSAASETQPQSWKSRICAMSGWSVHVPAGSPLLEYEREELKRVLDQPSHPELLGRLGRYELEELIGRGGMGLVFRAYDTELHRVVAIKLLAFHWALQPQARERFVRESRACASLVHPHVVPLYDVLQEGALPALVMQFIAGPTLQQWIDDRGTLPWQDAVRIAMQLTDGLAAAHRMGLIHRDIKPSNILLEADGARAVLTDFGMARILDATTLTHSGSVVGTPDFMSPEQVQGRGVDERSDLFALGTVLYTMLAGKTPFQADEPMAVLHRVCHDQPVPLRRIREDIPLKVQSVVEKLLCKQADKRYASANEVQEALLAVLNPSVKARSWYGLLQERVPGSVAVVGMVASLVLGWSLYSFLAPREDSTTLQLNRSRTSEWNDQKLSRSGPLAENASDREKETLGVSMPSEMLAIDRELISLRLVLDQFADQLESPKREAPFQADSRWMETKNDIESRLQRLERELARTKGY